jgi:hypothetical protein
MINIFLTNNLKKIFKLLQISSHGRFHHRQARNQVKIVWYIYFK